jgi:hypothetical protein
MIHNMKVLRLRLRFRLRRKKIFDELKIRERPFNHIPLKFSLNLSLSLNLSV